MLTEEDKVIIEFNTHVSQRYGSRVSSHLSKLRSELKAKDKQIADKSEKIMCLEADIDIRDYRIEELEQEVQRLTMNNKHSIPEKFAKVYKIVGDDWEIRTAGGDLYVVYGYDCEGVPNSLHSILDFATFEEFLNAVEEHIKCTD